MTEITKEKFIKFENVFVILATSFGLIFFSFASASTTDGTIDSIYKYAWSNNAGWLNFGTTDGNVHVTNTTLTGYVWNENYGWINLAPVYSGVKNDGSGTLSGSAWGENVGWIDFSGVSINCSGKFTGTATGDTAGTITFDCTNCNVITDWRAASCTGGGLTWHNECKGSLCVAVLGWGADECSPFGKECPAPICGDGYCDRPAETCTTCPEDDCCEIPILPHNECDKSSHKCVLVNTLGANECPIINDWCCDPRGDLNFDDHIALTDFSILMFYWKQTPPDYQCADINKDGTVDLTDFSIMLYWWTE